jgi:hypothetical protein
MLAAALGVVAIVSAACQSGDDPSGGSGPGTAASAAVGASADAIPSGSSGGSAAASAGQSAGSVGEETSVFDLEEGDCFGAAGEQVETVGVVDCEEPHIYEVFALVEYESDDDEYPGEEAVSAYADEQCEAEFEDFVGLDYESSRWFITSVTPSEETWADGDREIVCALNLEDESEVTGSAEDSGE